MAKEYQHRFFKKAKNWGLRSLFFVLLGFLLGILSKWMDIIPPKQIGFWGPLFSAGAEIFSRINIWILLAVWIAVCSKTPLQAALSAFLFFSSMLTGYYGYAVWADAYYSIPYVDWLVRCCGLHTGICCTELVYDTKRESTVDSPYGNHKLHDFHLFPLRWPYFYS